MVDKILYVNSNHIVIYFDKRVFHVVSDRNDALKILDELLAPLTSVCETYTEYIKRVKSCEEDTEVINLEDVA